MIILVAWLALGQTLSEVPNPATPSAPDQLAIYLNEIEMPVEGVFGVGLINSHDAWVGLNRISGNALAGAFLDASSSCAIANNDLTGLESQVGDVLLSPTTSQCHVVVDEGDTVVDNGTDNTIIWR